MADVPFYMQGSQTGGILQNLPAATGQSYIPSISGTQAQQYTPGYGQALYAQPQGIDALNAAIKAAQPYGQAAVNKAVAAYNSGQNMGPGYQGTGQGPFSVVPSQQSSPQGIPSATSTPGSNGFTTIGQSDAWMSPEQMRTATGDLQSHQVGDTGSGKGAGAGSGTGTAPKSVGSSGGLNLSGVGAAPIGATPGSLTQSSTPIGGTIGYQDPGSITNNGTAGYIAPGSTNSGGQAGVLAMNPANGQDALNQYKGTPGYQLLNDPGAYQQSPGYQYAMDQAMNQVQNGASAHGMLESGAVLRQMQQTASGLAQQDYGNWWNRQNQLYGDYQNRLQGLAGGPTGSADAMTAGANAAQANLQTGSNLGSLFGNQGTAGMGGIINTAAAQSNNMTNAGQQQVQVNAANQATQLAGATLSGNQNKGLF